VTSAVVIVGDSSNDMARTLHGSSHVVSQYAIREVMARCGAVTAMVHIAVFWNMMPCGLAVGQ
jgi:hypothetical protein